MEGSVTSATHTFEEWLQRINDTMQVGYDSYGVSPESVLLDYQDGVCAKEVIRELVEEDNL